MIKFDDYLFEFSFYKVSMTYSEHIIIPHMEDFKQVILKADVVDLLNMEKKCED